MADQLTLQRLRFDAGLTPEELGDAVHVAGQTIRRLEDSGKRPTPRVAKKLADYFNVKPSDLWPLVNDDPEPLLVGHVRKEVR